MTEFVDAYSTATGRKQRVPAHYLDHPVLGKGLAKTPRIKAREKAAETPADTTSSQTVQVTGDETPATGAKE